MRLNVMDRRLSVAVLLDWLLLKVLEHLLKLKTAEMQRVLKVTQGGTVQQKITVDRINVDAPADPARSGRAVPQQQRHQSFAAE